MKNHLRFTCLLCVSILVSLLSITPTLAEYENLPEFKFTDLGTQVEWVRISQIDVIQNESGEPLLYAVMEGKPAKLVIIDLNSNTILKSVPVRDIVNGQEETTEGLRGVAVAPDGTAYMGGYFSNHLFKHEPGSDHVTSLGPPVAGEKQVWKMVSGENGMIYGGTYGSGQGWIYDPSIGRFINLGNILPPQAYVYSIDYDDDTDTIYFGMGAEAHLIKYDVSTGEKSEISLGDYQHKNFVFDLTVTEDKIFAVMSPGSDTLVIDKEDEEIEYIIPKVLSRGGVSDKAPDNNKVYFSRDQSLFYYDTESGKQQSLSFNLGGEASGFGFVELDDPKFPGYSVVGITREGRLFKYNPQTDYREIVPVPIEGEPGQLHSIASDANGRIHMSAYLGAGTAVYDSNTGETTTFTAADVGVDQVLYQAEKILPYQDKILYGKYSGAVIYSFDPDLPWDMDKDNPKILFKVGKSQDRPFAMLGLEDEDKLFVGTVPTYGELGGALTVYDFKSDTKDVYRNIIPNQSIVSLTNKDKLLYGGTSIWGGLGVEPIEKEAKLFIWDIDKSEKVFETVPVPGKKAITALISGPDGNIWGLAEGTLFIFDPDTRQVVYSEEKFDRSYSSAVWRDALLEIGQDGNIYGTISKQFFMIDAETKEVHVIRVGENRIFLTQDPFGNFYYIENDKLHKASSKDLVLKLKSVILEADKTTLSPGGTALLTLSGKMSNGTDAPLDNAKIEYYSDQSNLVEIGKNGQLKLAAKIKDVRSFKVWADVTLNGTRVSSTVLEFNIAINIPMMLEVLDCYQKEISKEAYRSLKLHLTAVGRYEEQQADRKIVKHMEDFKLLLDFQKENGLISQKVYEVLKTDADALILKWQ